MSKPPRTSQTPLLTPQQRQSILKLDSEISEIELKNDTILFVLGSFSDGKKEKLETVCELADSTNVSAKLMEEFLNEEDDKKYTAIINSK